MKNINTKPRKEAPLIKRLKARGFKIDNKPGMGFGITGFPYHPDMEKSRKRK